MTAPCEHPEGFLLSGYSGESASARIAHLICTVCGNGVDRRTARPKAELDSMLAAHAPKLKAWKDAQADG